MRMGIYLGSFNPVHKAHIKIVNHLLDNNYLDKVLIIPTGNYWDKNNLVNVKHRTEMLKFFESSKIEIDTTNNLYPYSYLVLESLEKKYSDDFLYLILGADNIINFDKWKNYEELLKYNFIIINRNEVDILSYLEKLGKKDGFIIVDDLDKMDISATKIRSDIRSGVLSSDLDSRVYNYIKENELYKNN